MDILPIGSWKGRVRERAASGVAAIVIAMLASVCRMKKREVWSTAWMAKGSEIGDYDAGRVQLSGRRPTRALGPTAASSAAARTAILTMLDHPSGHQQVQERKVAECRAEALREVES